MRFKQAYPMISVVVTYIMHRIMHKTLFMTLNFDKIKKKSFYTSKRTLPFLWKQSKIFHCLYGDDLDYHIMVFHLGCEMAEHYIVSFHTVQLHYDTCW